LRKPTYLRDEYRSPHWKDRNNEFVDSNGGHFGVLVNNFQMKPYMPFVSSDTGMHITTTSILVDLPNNYPFSPPRVTFKDKIARLSIDSDGRYIGKAMGAWTPGVSLADYVSSVQHELFLAA
jgi:ubiquitin-protein ligase